MTPPPAAGDVVVLFARDPWQLVATWRITTSTRLRVLRGLGARAVGAVDACRLVRDGAALSDRPMPPGAGEWTTVAEPGHRYVLEVGIGTRDGGFTALARSEATTTPAAAPSKDLDVRWVAARAPLRRVAVAWTGTRVRVPTTPHRPRTSSDAHTP